MSCIDKTLEYCAICCHSITSCNSNDASHFCQASKEQLINRMEEKIVYINTLKEQDLFHKEEILKLKSEIKSIEKVLSAEYNQDTDTVLTFGID